MIIQGTLVLLFLDVYHTRQGIVSEPNHLFAVQDIPLFVLTLLLFQKYL